MAHGICDICATRPATAKARLSRNGKEEIIEVCSVDLERLGRQQFSSPIQLIYSSSMGDLDPVFGDVFPIANHRQSVQTNQFFSDYTKALIIEAAKKAASQKRDEVDTEHLLYAISDADGVRDLYRQNHIEPEDIKTYLDDNAPVGKHTFAGDVGSLAISPRLKTVLESAFIISRELGHGYIGPEHLLIALAGNEGLAGELLRKYGLTTQNLRQQFIRTLGTGLRDKRIKAPTHTPYLDKYSRDISQLAKDGKLDPVIGRQDEIETTFEILSRRTKNNPVLIGEPGVGKTAIVEGLAQRIVNDDIPEVLQGKRVVELILVSVVAGSKFRGDFEERIKQILDEIIEHKDELIIFIDELHTLIGAGGAGSEGVLDASNVIKPHLARGEMHLIGATTLDEYQKYIEKDAALERRFQPVYVAEPSVQETVQILHGLRDKYEAHHKVKITDEAIDAAAKLSDRYISSRYLPDKAIDLIDQAASRVRIHATDRPPQIKRVDDQLTKLKREQAFAESHKQFAELQELTSKTQALSDQKELLMAKFQHERDVTTAKVNDKDIAQVISKLTGIPITELTEEEKQKLLQMEAKLHERVVGQDQAITAVADAIRRSRAGLTSGNQPIANFLFLGPSGVGKTELAKSLAWAVFGDEAALTRIDMSEYRENFSSSRLIGAPPGFVGYEEGGQLTEPVRRRPYSVILLDDIEKAHPEIYNILLQVFDDGRLTDGKGRVVDFANTIIIATSNLGAEIIKQKLDGDTTKTKLGKLLRLAFKAEFLNRLNDIIVFNLLTQDQIKQIAKLQLQLVKHIAAERHIDLIFDESLVDHLVKVGFVPDYGARELKRVIQAETETVLAKAILAGELTAGETVRLSYQDGKGIAIHKIQVATT